MLGSIFKKPLNSGAAPGADTASSAYADTMLKACSTHAGALKVVAQLAAEKVAAGATGPRRRLIQRQEEVAIAAAAHFRLRDDLQDRIPAAMRRDAEAFKRDKDQAEMAVKAAKDVLTAASLESEKRTRELDALESARAQVLDAARAEVARAEVALQEAQDAGDESGSKQAVAALDEAMRAMSDIEQGQKARDVQLKIATAASAKARKVAEEAAESLRSAESLADLAQLRQNTLEADRCTLDTLMAQIRVGHAGRKVGGYLPAAFDNALFFFHQAERSPLWAGVAGPITIDPRTRQQIGRAADSPNWAVFAVDPATLIDAVDAGPNGPVPSTRAATEPFDPNVSYPPGHPHFAQAVGLMRRNG